MSILKKSTDDVAITGMGIISSIGQGISKFQQALYEGKNNFSTQFFSSLSHPVVGAFIDDYSSEKIFEVLLNLPKNTNKERNNHINKLKHHIPRHAELALIAVFEAWQQAGLNDKPIDGNLIALIVAAQNTMSHYQYEKHAEFLLQPDFLSPYYALHSLDTHYLGYLSDIFGIFGEGFTVGGASASGNIALLRAYDLIRTGRQNICVVVGAAADLSPLELQGFYNIGAMGGLHNINDPNKACRPFDQASDGFIYGQASACLILESISSATQRDIPILGRILGGCETLDGNYLSNSSVEGEIRTMQKALEISKIDINEINYINAHGSSSPSGDINEVKAIESLLGQRSQAVMLNSTKSIIGHCLWSAGIAEAIATIIQMNNKFVHPNLNLEHPIPNICKFIMGESKTYPINFALSNSFGFGGINTSLVLASN